MADESFMAPTLQYYCQNESCEFFGIKRVKFVKLKW